MDLLTFNEITFAVGDKASITTSGSVRTGTLLQVRGPSGTGKSTLLRVLARLRQRTAGEMSLRGVADHQITPVRWRRQIHYISQRPVAFPGTVLDNILLPYSLGIMRGELAPQVSDIHATLDALWLDPGMLTQQAKTLSGGELARVALACAILSKPTILMLDEPTSSLDAATREVVLSFLNHWLQENEHGMVLVTHLEEDLDAFQRVNILDINRTNGGSR